MYDSLKLKQYADNITAEFNKHAKAVQTKCPHITKKTYHSNDNERKLDEDADDFLDIKVEIVDVKVKSVHHHVSLFAINYLFSDVNFNGCRG